MNKTEKWLEKWVDSHDLGGITVGEVKADLAERRADNGGPVGMAGRRSTGDTRPATATGAGSTPAGPSLISASRPVDGALREAYTKLYLSVCNHLDMLCDGGDGLRDTVDQLQQADPKLHRAIYDEQKAAPPAPAEMRDAKDDPRLRPPLDSNRLTWLEDHITLHKNIEFLYVVDGWDLTRTYDGDPDRGFHGGSLREAIDQAMEAEEGDK